MRERRWEIDLGNGFEIRVFLETYKGQVQNFTVALIRAGQCVTRYDCAHGTPHRDVNGRETALVRKEFCYNATKAEVFIGAIRDFKENYQRHFKFYDTH